MADKIIYIDRETGKEITENVPGGKALRFMYHNAFGKLGLHAVIKRKLLSGMAGRYMDAKRSRRHIAPFLEKHQLDLSDYVVPQEGFRTFNDFFYRKVKPGARPIGEGLVSPADGKVVAFQRIEENTKFFIKGFEFSPIDFLKDKKLAHHYHGGAMVIVRLAPVDYHRFHFPAAGKAGKSVLIKGKYYSVSPIALKNSLKIFVQNIREYCLLETAEFGKVIISEVGATMVGSIVQTYEPDSMVDKGQEKGYFAFGGSTVVLLFEPGKVILDQDLLDNSARGIEMQVKMGARIGMPG
ncbi:MAG: phosphatidylserine decarboxylase [Bacteroidia bacterium]|nr:phosphatidylserine decarboxylase [Bacteroidia bacterium]